MTRSRWTLSLLCWTVFFASSVHAQEAGRTASREDSRGLMLPGRVTLGHESASGRSRPVSTLNGFLNSMVSLGLIVGTLFVAGRWLKRKGFQASPLLPIEAFEILGRRTLESKVAVHLVRCGSRVLLLGVGADGVRTLSEIDDPAEVELLTRVCLEPVKRDRDLNRAAVTAGTQPISTSPQVSQRIFTGVLLVGTLFFQGRVAEAQGVKNKPSPTRPREQVERTQRSRDLGIQPVGMESLNPPASEPQALSTSHEMISPQQLNVSLKMLALMTVFGLAPSILMMSTCFVRFIVVLGLLRQALGTQQGPPNQVLTAICLFLTFLVMSPVWQRSYREGIQPYTNPVAGSPSLDETAALTRTLAPVRGFMSEQIDKAGNADAVWMLLDFQRPASGSAASQGWQEPESYDDVPFTVLAPAYLLSELKVGFLIGFQLFLPFLVIDLVVAVLLTSLGLTMLPPSMVSLPFKLLLFVLIDGWFLTVGMLLESVRVA